jgi:hypothetical protein
MSNAYNNSFLDDDEKAINSSSYNNIYKEAERPIKQQKKQNYLEEDRPL